MSSASLGAVVFSDGLACFNGVATVGGAHHVQNLRLRARNATFCRVNTDLANVKDAMTGTYRHISLKHAPRYLAQFRYQFNHGFDVAQMLAQLAFVSVRARPMPYRLRAGVLTVDLQARV